MSVALLTYWVTHPAAVQRLMQVAGLAASALAHAHGDQGTAQSLALWGSVPTSTHGTMLALGSHWH